MQSIYTFSDTNRTRTHTAAVLEIALTCVRCPTLRGPHETCMCIYIGRNVLRIAQLKTKKYEFNFYLIFDCRKVDHIIMHSPHLTTFTIISNIIIITLQTKKNRLSDHLYLSISIGQRNHSTFSV